MRLYIMVNDAGTVDGITAKETPNGEWVKHCDARSLSALCKVAIEYIDNSVTRMVLLKQLSEIYEESGE